MTLRELDLAYRAKVDFHWTQTAEVIAAVLNIRQRGKNDTKVYRGCELYQPISAVPARRTPARLKFTTKDLHAMKGLFPCKSR